jgi:hypothetical protein
MRMINELVRGFSIRKWGARTSFLCVTITDVRQRIRRSTYDSLGSIAILRSFAEDMNSSPLKLKD